MSYKIILHRGKVAVTAPPSPNPCEVEAPDGSVVVVPAGARKVTTPTVDPSFNPTQIDVAPYDPAAGAGPIEATWVSGGAGFVPPDAPPPDVPPKDEPPLIY